MGLVVFELVFGGFDVLPRVGVFFGRRQRWRSRRWATTSVAPRTCEAAGVIVFAGQHFVDAGDESRFAVVDVLRIERESEHRLQVEPLALAAAGFLGAFVGEGPFVGGQVRHA